MFNYRCWIFLYQLFYLNRLVGTQIDKREQSPQNNCISAKYGKKLAKEIGASSYIECSALTGEVSVRFLLCHPSFIIFEQCYELHICIEYLLQFWFLQNIQDVFEEACKLVLRPKPTKQGSVVARNFLCCPCLMKILKLYWFLRCLAPTKAPDHC